MQCHVSLHVIAVRCSVFKKKKIKTFLFLRGHGNESCGLITIYSLKNSLQSKKDLTLITALNQSGSFGKNVVKF